MSPPPPPEHYTDVAPLPERCMWMATRRDTGALCKLALPVCWSIARSYDDVVADIRARVAAPHPSLWLPERVRALRPDAGYGDRELALEFAPSADLSLEQLRIAQRDHTARGRAPVEAARLALALCEGLEHTFAPNPRLNHAYCDSESTERRLELHAYHTLRRCRLSPLGRLRFAPLPFVPFPYIGDEIDRRGLAYITPESARALPTSAASHVCFAGLVLYHLWTGGEPWGDPGNAYQAFHNAAFGQLQPIEPCHPEPALEAIVRRCVHMDPGQRFASPRALGSALRRFIRQREPTFPSPDAQHATPNALLGALRESLNAGHASSAVEHLNRARPEARQDPAVYDYLRAHVGRAAPEEDATDPEDTPLDWARLHLGAQLPETQLTAFHAGLAPEGADAPARDRARMWWSWLAGPPGMLLQAGAPLRNVVV